ncbi:hypothetical protein KUL150_22050 [Alteromonas sp. KUL150]|nr:hypothetical protein KUL150_22050 [Alteromonas sp. KUL150]
MIQALILLAMSTDEALATVAMLAQYMTSQRFLQPDIAERLPEVCKKISYFAPYKQKETVQRAY